MLNFKTRLIMDATTYFGIHHDNFMIQTDSSDFDTKFKFALNIPIYRKRLIKRAISEGRIYLRPDSVDPNKPNIYFIDGWQVRNTSQRADGYNSKQVQVPLVKSSMRYRTGK